MTTAAMTTTAMTTTAAPTVAPKAAAKTATKAAAKMATKAADIPRGKPVSGRPWKTVQKARFSTAKYTGTRKLSTTWEDKLVKRARTKELKVLQDEIKTRRQGERDAKRQAREDKEKRRKENELKSASVQVISRTHRIKGMSKKQLRNVKKTIVNKQGVVEYVPLYSK